jgi:hypothetical protein
MFCLRVPNGGVVSFLSLYHLVWLKDVKISPDVSISMSRAGLGPTKPPLLLLNKLLPRTLAISDQP